MIIRIIAALDGVHISCQLIVEAYFTGISFFRLWKVCIIPLYHSPIPSDLYSTYYDPQPALSHLPTITHHRHPQDLGIVPDKVIFMDATHEILVNRTIWRRMDYDTGKIYHVPDAGVTALSVPIRPLDNDGKVDMEIMARCALLFLLLTLRLMLDVQQQ
jgi:hypothetical protein